MRPAVILLILIFGLTLGLAVKDNSRTHLTGYAVISGSCEGSCGLKLGSCYCDLKCADYGDCCPDFKTVCQNYIQNKTNSTNQSYGIQAKVNSCEGFCGGKANGKCFCDSSCQAYGDCCEDFDQYCKSETEKCKDSDLGKNNFVKGSGSGLSGAKQTTFEDQCVKPSGKVTECTGDNCELIEYYCQGKNVAYEKVKCANGCKNGACDSAKKNRRPRATISGSTNKGKLNFTAVAQDDDSDLTKIQIVITVNSSKNYKVLKECTFAMTYTQKCNVQYSVTKGAYVLYVIATDQQENKCSGSPMEQTIDCSSNDFEILNVN